MLELNNFVFYGTPIRIVTEKWSIKFIPHGDNASIIEIIKYKDLGGRVWDFQITREETNLKLCYLEDKHDDPIGIRIYHVERLSNAGTLSWYDINTMFRDIITNLNA